MRVPVDKDFLLIASTFSVQLLVWFFLTSSVWFIASLFLETVLCEVVNNLLASSFHLSLTCRMQRMSLFFMRISRCLHPNSLYTCLHILKLSLIFITNFPLCLLSLLVCLHTYFSSVYLVLSFEDFVHCVLNCPNRVLHCYVRVKLLSSWRVYLLAFLPHSQPPKITTLYYFDFYWWQQYPVVCSKFRRVILIIFSILG